MDSFELNKIAGAVLAVLLVIFGARTLVNEAFHPEAPETPGYEIAVAALVDEGDAAGSSEPEVAPIGIRLASADAGAGEKVFKKCVTCHAVEADGGNKVGPNLHNSVGRALGAVDGFAYSNALIAHGGVWDYAALDAFFENPKGYISGTKMAFAGLRKPEDRANVIAYLMQYTDNPPPLPEAVASEGDAAAAE